jgi:hypothetical protein
MYMLILNFTYPLRCLRVPPVEYHWSKACTVYDRSKIGIAGSNPASGMDVCPRVSVLCYPVSVEALRRADPPSKESYQNVPICRSRKPIRIGQRSAKDCKCLLKKNYISMDYSENVFACIYTRGCSPLLALAY